MKNILFITVFSLCLTLGAQELQPGTSTTETATIWSGLELFKYNNPLVKVNKINTAKSSIEWTGSKLFNLNKHSGTVKIESGTIFTEAFKIVGGNFVIDMNTIVNTDGKYNEMLVNHLKSNDFFNVKKYPKASLKITKAIYKDEAHAEVFAELTIKNITKPIKFNATLGGKDGNVQLKSQFNIDRTQWGINYESKGLLGSVKDDIISDTIEFEVVIEWTQDMC